MSDLKEFVTMITRILLAIVIIITVHHAIESYEKIETAKLACRDTSRQLVLDHANRGVE